MSEMSFKNRFPSTNSVIWFYYILITLEEFEKGVQEMNLISGTEVQYVL